MKPVAEERAKERARLRENFKQAVARLLQALDSQPKDVYPVDELENLGVSLVPFDPHDQEFLDSKACLFEPMPAHALEEWSLDESDLNGGAIDYYIKFDEIYHHPTNLENPPLTYVMEERADQAFNHLDILYTNYERKNGRDIEFLNNVVGWDQIKHDNSFSDGPMGLLLGIRLGPRHGLAYWGTKTEREWQQDYDNPETTRPHILLAMCTGAEVNDGELLFGELGPIVQAIHNRLSQEEFEQTSLFPVLAISFFGPRHGRLLQAKFTKSGVLKVRASPIYSFLRKAEAPFRLFLRYCACEPRDGPEYEFYSDDEDEPTYAPKYVSPFSAGGKYPSPGR